MPDPPLPYRNLASYLRETFDRPVAKITVDAGFTCPMRDGTLDTEGCTFCAVDSFRPASLREPPSLEQQIDRARRRLRSRRPDLAFLVYFQPHTNTHASVDVLEKTYRHALLDDVVALSVGTRPDCVPDPVLDLLASYAPKRDVWLELGLQSAHDETLRRIRRRHDYACFADAVHRAMRRGLKTLAHVILGLPGEEAKHVRETARRLASLPLDGVKIHHLYVAEGTALAENWRRGNVKTLSVEEHADLATDFLERIPSDVVVHRLVSDPAPELLLAPRWEVSKPEALRLIVETFRRRGTRQGSRAKA